MTTATGDYALDFSAASDENPWANANFTAVNTGSYTSTARILSNLLQENGNCLYIYTGGTYDDTDVVTAKVEVVGNGGSGDLILLGAVDENGDGYLLSVNGSLLSYSYRDAYASAEGLGSKSGVTINSGDVISIEVTKGSPNSLKAYQNGVEITGFSGATTDVATLGTLKAAFGFQPDNTGNVSIRSLAVDGLVTLAPIIMRWQR